MKKRLIALFLALAMLLALAACGSKQDPAEEETPEEAETAEPEQAAGTEKTDDGETVDSEETADDTVQSDVIDIDDAEADLQPEVGSRPADLNEATGGGNLPADTNQKPEAKPVQKPEEVPAAKPEPQEPAAPTSKTVDLAAFYESLTGGEDWPAMMQMEGETLDAFYPGLSEIGTSQCAVYMAMISAAVGEIALVEVQNADDVQRVKDIFQARIDYQVGDDENPGGAWYPESIEGWKSGSRIVSNGSYVMLVALSDGADDVVTAFNALFA